MKGMEVNAIYEGDNLEIMSKFPSESVDLIYADPPFYTNKGFEVIWKDAAEIRAFEDRWAGGIEHYIAWMEPRLRECYRLLRGGGSLYVHCDWHANAHLRILLDKIFQKEKCFKNLIVWKKTNSVKAQTSGFGNQYDSILFYAKDPSKMTFNIQKRIPDGKYLAAFRYDDNDGKGLYQTVALSNTTPSGGFAHMKEYEWRGATARWIYSKEKLEEFWKEGKIYKTKGGLYRLKHYLKEAQGPPLSDIWTDEEVAPIQGQSKEFQGYPTQKPVALLERIVRASSNEGDIVLDPFCGCGTTLVASQKLKRKWIGIDVSPTACKLMRKRLQHEFKVNGQLIRGEVDLNYVKKLPPFEFQNWVVVDKFYGRVSPTKSGDMGVDGFTPQITGGYPIQVKQSEDIGRNVIDNFETAMRRMKKKKGYVVALSFGKGAVEEVARAKNQDGIEIILRTVDDLLNGKIEDDNQHRLPVEPR